MRRLIAQFLACCCVTAVAAGPAQALAPVGSGVVGLWQGEGDAADPFNAHDGTLLGGAAVTPGASGQAFAFAGAEQAVDIPDSPDLYPAGSFSVAGWIRTTDSASYQVLIEHYECGLYCPTNQANSVYLLGVIAGHAEGEVRDAAGAAPGDGGQTLDGSTNIADGAFHHLAFVRNVADMQLKLFVDGAAEVSVPLLPAASGALENQDGEPDDVYLGAVRRCGPPVPGCDGLLVGQLTGAIDDAVYWSRPVSDSEIAAIHAAGPNGLTTDATAPASAATAPPAVVSGPIAVGFSAADEPGPVPRVHDPSTLARVDLYAKAPGESAFRKVATTPGAAAGGFTYAPVAGPGAYAFATAAVDVAGNAEALPGTPDAVTTVAAPVTAAPPITPRPQVARPRDPKRVEQVVAGLPSTRRCVSRRAFRIRLKLPRNSSVRRASVSVNGRRVAVRSGKRLTAPVNLKGLPIGKYSVKITLKLAGGRTLSSTRRYRTCARKRR